MKRCFSVLVILLYWQVSTSQSIFPPDSNKKRVTATAIVSSMQINGQLDEPEWQLATPVTDFIQSDPSQGETAKRKTTVKILYNKAYLYVGAVCYDTVAKNNYRTLNFKRDFAAASTDFFALAIDGYNDERNCIMFMANPYGAQKDLLSFDDNFYDVDWDGLWIVRTQRTDSAWIAEIAIPWKTLRYKNAGMGLQTFGISFARNARSINETSNFPAVPRAYGGLRMPYAAKLTDIAAPMPATNIRVQPYTMYSHNQTKEQSKTTVSKNTVKPGGDIKWAINTNTLLDLSFNTDFAQADVDRKVNNINRFSIFYPERRQFFLENAGLFSAGIEPLSNDFSEYSAHIQPFFSRSIGLDATGNPLQIDAGARLIYRSDKTNLGGMYIRQEGNSTTGPTDFLVGRYSQNFGKQNRIGALVSYKDVAGKESDNGSKNLTGTIDCFLRINQSLSWSFMGSATSDPGKKTGYAGSSQLVYNTNNWNAWWNESAVTNQYNPKMGFEARDNAIISDAGFTLQQRGKWLPHFIRAFSPGLSLTYYHNTSTGKLTDRYFSVSPLGFKLQNGGVVAWFISTAKQDLQNSFSPLGITIDPGIYNYVRHKILVSTDPSRKITVAMAANFGQFYNGQYNSASVSFCLAPSPYLYLAPTIEIGQTSKLGPARASQTVSLYTMEGRFALNPRLQLTGLYQQSNISHSTGWNIRFAWEFKPLSYVYLVYNRNLSSQANKTIDEQFIAKISYLKQF